MLKKFWNYYIVKKSAFSKAASALLKYCYKRLQKEDKHGDFFDIFWAAFLKYNEIQAAYAAALVMQVI